MAPTQCAFGFKSHLDIPPGGEGESEEDEEDETVAELKKPNTDEVRAIGYGSEGLLD